MYDLWCLTGISVPLSKSKYYCIYSFIISGYFDIFVPYFHFSEFWYAKYECVYFFSSSSRLHPSRHADNVPVWNTVRGTSIFHRKPTSMFWNGKWPSTDCSPHSNGYPVWHYSTGVYCAWAVTRCTRWFKYDRDWFVCKQAALRSSCGTLREWSHNLHPPSCSG